MKPPRTDRSAAEAYAAAQTLARSEQAADPGELAERAGAWKDAQIPELQRRGVEIQLAELGRGNVDPVFASLARALAAIRLEEFSLLDAACASGYYRTVIEALDGRSIRYHGCDYSSAMIAAARARAPGVPFEVQDLVRLDYPDRRFDVVLLSGVLEHVPDFPRAIAEACRVARSHVVLHRVPLRRFGGHRRTLGAQYNIETPRIYFSRRGLLAELEAAGFGLVAEADTYPRAGLVGRLRRLLGRHPIRTLVLERAASKPR